VSQRSDSRINYKLKWWGRVDCEKTGKTCIGANGQAVTCSSKKGPHHEFPNINLNTHELFGFFKDEFGFNQRDAVAAMGAHTIGEVRQEVRRCIFTIENVLNFYGCNKVSQFDPIFFFRILILMLQMVGYLKIGFSIMDTMKN
jgi:Peroxidase